LKTDFLALLLLSCPKADEEKSEGHRNSLFSAQARTSEEGEAWGDVTLSDCECVWNSQLTLDSDRVKRAADKSPTSRRKPPRTFDHSAVEFSYSLTHAPCMLFVSQNMPVITNRKVETTFL
jgi:hypothetical protein